MSRVYFFARRYPPSVGGMEAYSVMVADSLRRILPRDRDLVIHAYGGQRKLGVGWFLKAIFLVLRHRVGGRYRKAPAEYLFSDAFVLTLLSWVLPRKDRRTFAFIHGLDLCWSPKLYQMKLRRSLRKCNQLFSNSHHTSRLLREQFSLESKVLHPVAKLEASKYLEPTSSLPSELFGSEVPLLLLVGRNVARKGFGWFIEEVLPLIETPTQCVIAGPGTLQLCDSEQSPNSRRVGNSTLHILGPVDEQAKKYLMDVAQLFLQPNLPISGDVEGFGIVVQEAALASCYVIGADLEGLKESIFSNDIGILLPHGRAQVWSEKIDKLLNDGSLTLRQKGASAAAQLFNSTARVDSVLNEGLGCVRSQEEP